MTITDTTPQLRDMTDDDLLALYREADELTAAAAMREAARRDRDKTLAASRRKLAEIHAEGYDAAYAQYLMRRNLRPAARPAHAHRTRNGTGRERGTQWTKRPAGTGWT
jgi:hypothetical protein